MPRLLHYVWRVMRAVIVKSRVFLILFKPYSLPLWWCILLMRRVFARQSLRRALSTSNRSDSAVPGITGMRLRSSGPADADASLESKPVVVKVEAERQPSTSRPSRRRIKAQESVGVKREKVEKVEQDAAPPTPKKRAKKIKERVPRQEPSGWREILRGIEEMRANKDAEVDKYGCEVRPMLVAKLQWRRGSLSCSAYDCQVFFDESFPPHVCRFHVLIAAMMSSQTKDPVNAAAMGRLIKHGLTVESMFEIDQQELAQLIRPVGFFNHKAKYIKQTAAILTKQAEVEGNDIVDIPNTYEGLVALPGVGPKMSTLVMNCAWKKYGCTSSMGENVEQEQPKVSGPGENASRVGRLVAEGTLGPNQPSARRLWSDHLSPTRAKMRQLQNSWYLSVCKQLRHLSIQASSTVTGFTKRFVGIRKLSASGDACALA
ncbi:hypothetical protein ON010_g6372 [Phytophthora cinnamomi]|nr:hypothetical protein ON010_g6372 [Phytophthora cinnamomi]